MDVGEGMVAMVRGLRDASLAVTLLDGTRKYTLMPNNAQFSNPMHVQIVRKQENTQECARPTSNCRPSRCEVPTRCESTARCESSAQATDGRYASMYKTAHCHVTPTSPAVELTEFPPQRAEISPGHDNFEVGGAGSGDTYSPTRASASFRGGMSWTDIGSVYDPRPSHRPDAFANSLRKYPNVSPERSTETVERLISYSQFKNAKNNIRSQTSPSRFNEANSSRMQKTRDHEFSYRTKKEESPTRDIHSRKCDYECTDFRRAVFRNYDVRFLREVPNRTRDSGRNLPAQNTNSVDMEIQAVVETTSREVATMPRADTSKRNVAVPLSPATSTVERNNEGEDRASASYPTNLYKNIQTVINRKKNSLGQLKSVQTSSSSIQLSNPDCVCRCSYDDYRKSKSEEELRIRGAGKESPHFTGILNLFPSPKKMFCVTKKIIENVPVSCTKSNHCKDFRIVKDNLEVTLNEWLKDIPIKNKDFIGRHINRQQATRIISNKLKQVIFNAEDEKALKSGIVKLVEEIPIDVNDLYKKKAYISTLADKFIQKSLEISEFNAIKHWKNRTGCNNNKREKNKKVCPYIFKNNIQLTEEEVRGFLSDILAEFLENSKSRICSKRLQVVEMELTDVLIHSLLELHAGNHITVKKELFFVLHEVGLISEYQAILLTDMLLERFKSFINVDGYDIKKYGQSHTFVVLQNTIQSLPHPATNSKNISIESISQRDIDACLDFYISRLIEEINSWLSSALGPEISFVREVAVNDLAGDIVDRLKYLDKNPAKQGSEKDELEFMRFQIYKWINRLVSDDAAQQAIERAPELMERIQTIPVPMLSRTGERENTLDSIPPCCVTQSSQMPILNATDQVANAIQASNNLNFTSSRPPSPWSLASAPMFENSENVNVSRTPMYVSSEYGMSEVRGSMLPGIHAAREEVASEIRKYNFNEMPIFGEAGKGGSMINAGSPNQGVRRISGPGAFDLETRARGPYQPEQRSPGSSAPIYVSSGQGVNMPVVSRPMTPGIRAAEEVPKFKNYNINEMPMFGVAGKGGSMRDADSSNNRVRRMSGPGVFDLETRTRGPYQPASRNPGRAIDEPVPRQSISTSQVDLINQSLDRIQTQYDHFLINWIKELPLPTATPEEKALADLIRLGFYNGVWKAVLKVTLDPTKYTDLVYCQSILDEEIQELLDALPETQEIEKKKDAIKTNLVQKTIDAISMIVAKTKAANYKQQLIEQVSNHLPKRVNISSDYPTDRHEELQKMQLVDAFILYTRYKEDDKVKANVYRKKLNDRVEDIFRDVKRTHRAPLIKIDKEVYKNEVINALHKVPLPTADVIKEEADEILLGIELEKWFSDLPIVANDDPAEQLDRRRILNAFAKHIHDMGKQMSLVNDSSVEQLKIATKRFLQKLPFQPNQEANLDFMAEEFANRLKNGARENAAQRPKSVSFEVPALYADFGQNVPLSSSVAEVNSSVVQGNDRSQQNESNQDQSGRSIHIIGNNYESSEPQEYASMLRVSTAENLRLLEQFKEFIGVQVSRQLPQHSQQAGGTIINPQQAGGTFINPQQAGRSIVRSQQAGGTIINPQQAAGTTISPQQAGGTIINPQQAGGNIISPRQAGGNIISPQQAGGTIVNPQQQIISESLIRASNQVAPASVLYTEPPQVMHTSFRGTIPVVQSAKATNESRIASVSQAQIVSGLPSQQRSNRTILNVPEVPISPPKVEFGNQRVGRTSIGSIHQPLPSKPIRILGTSQIAGSSGRQPMPKSSNAPTVMPNIIVNEPNPRPREVPEVVLSLSTANPQLAQPEQVPASSILTGRGLQNLSAPQPANPMPPNGNFYMSDQRPVANSTPQQCHPPQGVPPKLERKRPRDINRRRGGARRRLDFEDSDESESDEIECRCMERVYKCRRRRLCYCDDYNMMEYPRFFPMRYPHSYFF